MTNERLNSLILINIHKDVRINHEDIAKKYLQSPAIRLSATHEDNAELDLELMDDPEVEEHD